MHKNMNHHFLGMWCTKRLRRLICDVCQDITWSSELFAFVETWRSGCLVWSHQTSSNTKTNAAHSELLSDLTCSTRPQTLVVSFSTRTHLNISAAVFTCCGGNRFSCTVLYNELCFHCHHDDRIKIKSRIYTELFATEVGVLSITSGFK